MPYKYNSVSLTQTQTNNLKFLRNLIHSTIRGHKKDGHPSFINLKEYLIEFYNKETAYKPSRVNKLDYAAHIKAIKLFILLVIPQKNNFWP